MMVRVADPLAASGVTRQEAEVLAGLGEHLTNAEIAARMFVSERTVDSHVSSLLRKLHASDPRELGRLAGSIAEPSTRGSGEIGPSGTVTFLFTDVEDSTALWEQYPSLMPDVLARHDALVQDAITGHRGHIFTTAGDGFGAAFASASEAVGAAVDGQRSLELESWPGDVIVRVRMGLHSGTATERSGNYFGGAVNRAARIAAIGRGGHILLSAATADLVADEQWTVVDLGRHRLKGLERPERIVRLDVPGLPVVALSLRAGRDGAGNLPHTSTALIGRDDALRRLVGMLGTHRLVTVTGTGGTGKTRLALAAAAAVADQFPDGTWFVELGELQDAADVPSAVATTLALQLVPARADPTSSVAALADQQALLLLDNCEHLIDAVAQFVTAIESQCDLITVLATSREALGLGHEVRLNLDPLDVNGDGGTSDAMRLFCERAAAVLGSFQPSDSDVAVIDEICRRLDGLPLAIELAAARLSAMTVAELRAHLDDRLDVLTRRRGVNARQQSLRATVAWSYDLLTDVEQSFFDELSVFGADFGADAARAVGGDTTVPVDDLLMSLVDKSLLTASRGPVGMRFRQLETVRQYGEARLQGRGGMPASMRRQLDHYVAWTASADTGLTGPNELHWHQGFVAEWPNVRNVFRWACTVDDGDAACRLVSATSRWATSRMRLEAERWCELALEVPSAAEHPLRPVVLAGAALFAHTRGDPDREGRLIELARSEERRLGVAASPWVEAAALNQWNGGPAAAMRDAAALRLRAEQGADHFLELTAALVEALILCTLLRRGEPLHTEDEDVSRIRAIVELSEAFGQPSGVASAMISLGTALASSEPDAAVTLLEKALDACAPLDVEDTSAMARDELAFLYTRLGRPHEALTLVRDAIARYLRSGAWHEVWGTLAHVARALADTGRSHVAATVLGRLDAEFNLVSRNRLDFPGLKARLLSDLGAAELETALEQSRAIPIAELARLVIQTIDELAD
jgi:predicted ATPase/class 3 adenylate cyclase